MNTMDPRKPLSTAALTLLALLPLSCGDGGGIAAEPPDAAGGVPHLEVRSVLTIGIELGDTSYVFGTIGDAAPTGDGGAVVLDMFSMNVRRYDSTGVLTASAGREGSGPGEFLMPRGLTVLGNGGLLVSDMAAGAVSVFDDTLGWERSVTGFSPRPPFTMRTIGDSTYAGILPEFDRAAGTTGWSIVGLTASSPEPFVVYEEEQHPFDPSRMGPGAGEDQPLFAAGPDGTVYLSAPGPDAILVRGFSPDGAEVLRIDRPLERIEKTPEELAREEAEFEERSSGTGRGRRFGGGAAVFDPDPFRRAVTGLGVDASGRIWVRLGAFDYPFWQVFDASGELLFTASLELDDPDIADMIVRIERDGAVAWVEDPGTWPRVRLLSLPE